MKTTSRFALAAAAGLFVGALAISPAQAADLGGDCCADLEERVAELEATTVRKGNRVVSVQLYGQINRALMIWDDGVDSDAYIVDNDATNSRFGIRGSGTMKPGWTAGFRFEAEINDTESGSSSQFRDGDDSESQNGEFFALRRASVYIESAQLGRITMGQTSAATDDITLINLGGIVGDADNYYAAGFVVRNNDDILDTGGDDPGNDFLRWGDLHKSPDVISREDMIRYDSPSLYGFVLSAAWGDNDKYDFAARFSKEWNSIRVAAGIGYAVIDDDENDQANFDAFTGSGGLQHVPSGLFINFSAGQFEYDEASYSGEDESSYWYVNGGIERNWTGFGATSFWVGYGQYTDMAAVGSDVTYQDLDKSGAGANYAVLSSEVNRFVFGFNQDFDSAATQIYIVGNYYELDELVTDEGGDVDVGELPEEDFFSVAIGSRVRF